MRFRHWHLSTLLAVATLGAAVQADAAWLDNRYYMGSECVPVGYTSQGSSIVSAGGIRNGGTTTQGYYCPLRHYTSSYWTDDIAVYVLDRHYSEDAWCQVRAANPYGLSYSYTSKKYTSGSDTLAQKLSFGYFNSGNAWWYVACELPGTYSGSASAIHAYYSQDIDRG
ncbi:MAG: hypothetical protein KC776_17140 [Myxococcales bacterium]|nr:hypothetical protein [Myxococcales bacterium]MCB9583719.1 hypothetical protein [Polyangiaceae bacterium]